MKTRPSIPAIAAMFGRLFPDARSVIDAAPRALTDLFAVKFRSRPSASAGSGQPPDVWGQSRACHRMRRKNVRSGHVAHYRTQRAAR